MPIRYFTPGEATALLPRLAELLEGLRRTRDQAILKKAQVDLLWRELGEGHSVLSRLAEDQKVLDGLVARLAELAREVESTGCILRDVDLGLVDFPCKVRGGATVFLCWKLGEPGVQFWHGVDEGYAGRKPLAELPLDLA